MVRGTGLRLGRWEYFCGLGLDRLGAWCYVGGMTNTLGSSRPLPSVPSGPLGTGCYISGYWGQYAVDRLAVLCDTLAPHEYFTGAYWAETVAVFRSVEDWDRLSDLYDYLTDRLNDVTVGGEWYWEGGELFLTDVYFCADCGKGGETPVCDACQDERDAECVRWQSDYVALRDSDTVGGGW